MARLFSSGRHMIINYLTTAIRTIRRSTSYTLINVSGLTLGISCAIVIFSIVSYHLNFDTFHVNGDRIYRFVTEEHREDVEYETAVPPAFGKAFRDDYTFGEQVARTCRTNSLLSFELHGRNTKFQEDLIFADATYLDIFNFPLLSGANELAQPGTAIITQRIAKKFFGDENALGKVIRFENKEDFRIVGVLQDIPEQTDFRAEILLSYSNLKVYRSWYAADDSWNGIASALQTFTRLRPGVDPIDVEKTLPEYVRKFREGSKNVHHYKLQPLADIHFNAHYNGKVSKTALLVLSIIGFFLMATACLNFVNLATAQAIGRSREVGVRKVLGGIRTQLFWQFILETSIIVLASFLLSFSIAYAVMPMLNELIDARISIHLWDSSLWAFAATLIVAVTFAAGAYPGIMLARFKPVQALKGTQAGPDTLILRRTLITTQFAICHVLLIGLIVVLAQMHYFHHTDLGYERHAIVMIPLGSHDAKSQTLKNQFLQLPSVEHVTMCYSAPAASYSWESSLVFDQRAEAEPFASSFKGGDEDFLATFGIDLVAGRNLLPSDTIREYLVNETFARKIGLRPGDILGKNIQFNDYANGPIVGVVGDFNDQSLHNLINPAFITTSSANYTVYAVKINMEKASSALAALENTWSAMYPDQVYAFDFLDDQTAEFYQTEETMLRIVEIFSFVALVVGCIGLYGLASFMAARKTKEIGIRKVLGSSVGHILWIFGKEFSTLVLLAFAVAAPLSWYLMLQWLSNYPNRVDLGLWVFALDLAFVSIVVIATVGLRTAKAALTNPVGALRTE